MTILEVIRAELEADASVTALVGGRIYPQVLKQKTPTYPAVVITVITDLPQNTFDTAPTELLHNAVVQLDCYSPDYAVAHRVADAIANVIGSLSRDDLSATVESSRDFYDDETSLFRVSVDCSVWR